MERKVKLQITGMEKKYKNGDGVENINIDVYEGEFVTMLGPSGCGKSTILRTLGGFLDIDKGDILIDGESVKDLPPEKRPTAMVFQSYNLWPHMTVYENLAFGLEIKKTPKAEADANVEEMLDIVGLTKFRNYYPSQLSISMLQRVAIARAFATKPELLLMDEPYGQLDIDLRFKLEDELIKLWEMTKTTVIFITHNIEEAVYLGNRIMILTNKPTTVKRTVNNTLPRPRDIASPDFVALRTEVTDAIKWW